MPYVVMLTSLISSLPSRNTIWQDCRPVWKENRCYSQSAWPHTRLYLDSGLGKYILVPLDFPGCDLLTCPSIISWHFFYMTIMASTNFLVHRWWRLYARLIGLTYVS